MEHVFEYDPRRPDGKQMKRQIGCGLLFFGPIVLFFLYNCSGLHWPMWNPTGQLADRLSTELGSPLPPSAKVIHATREAYSDPAEYYAVEMPAQDVVPWIESIPSGQQSKEQPNPRSATIGVPTWWTPELLPKSRVLDFHRERGTFRICFGENDGRVFIAWLEY